MKSLHSLVAPVVVDINILHMVNANNDSNASGAFGGISICQRYNPYLIAK